MGLTVSVFFPNHDSEIVRVHNADCSHVTRDWRVHGKPVRLVVQSVSDIVRQLKRHDIRFKGIYVLPCAPIPEGYWSYSSDGEMIKLHATKNAASALSRKIRKIEGEHTFNRVTDLAPYMIERYGFKVTKISKF